MNEKDKKNNTEIEHPYIREIDHKTMHPGIDDEWSLYHVNYAPGENKDLTEI